MLRISDAVELSVKKKAFLETALKQGLINVSALARFLQPEIEALTKKSVKTGAIVMALNRLSPVLKIKEIDSLKVTRQIKDITVKSNLVEYTFTNSQKIQSKVGKFLDHISEDHEVFLTLTRGVNEMSFIVSMELEKQLQSAFENEVLKIKVRDMSAIIVGLPDENIQTPGVYYQILKQLAWNNINLVEVVSTPNEITLFFRDKDIESAFSVLKKLGNQLHTQF